jgi:hypothetical protein
VDFFSVLHLKLLIILSRSGLLFDLGCLFFMLMYGFQVAGVTALQTLLVPAVIIGTQVNISPTLGTLLLGQHGLSLISPEFHFGAWFFRTKPWTVEGSFFRGLCCFSGDGLPWLSG